MPDETCRQRLRELGEAMLKGPPIHDQAAKLRKDVGDVPDPEDSIDYDGLKASVGKITRDALDWLDFAFASNNAGMQRPAIDLAGYLRDVCSVHDIEIPEADDDD